MRTARTLINRRCAPASRLAFTRATTSDAAAAAATSAAATTSASWEYDYDILVAGGGIVGAAFAAKVAASCSRGRLKIGIVDARAPPALADCVTRPTPDLRTYALSPQSIAFLTSLGAWQHVDAAGRHQPYTHMQVPRPLLGTLQHQACRSHPTWCAQVWEAGGPGVVRFAAADMGAPSLGR
jgi:2-polyprenyl-6-methoxyphenol hydroxylase-like FAD-dependent oxidoreductase